MSEIKSSWMRGTFLATLGVSLLVFTLGVGGLGRSVSASGQLPQTEAQASGQLNGVGSPIAFLPLVSHDSNRPANVFGVETRLTVQDGLEKLIQTDTYWAHGIFAHWADIEPTEGARNWAAMAKAEEQLKIAASNDLTPIVMVRMTPSWAQKYPGVKCGEILTSKIDEFATFMGDLVARYSAAPYYVDYWEIWNEPDVPPHLAPASGTLGCWGDDDDPSGGYGGGTFANMLKQVYPAMKAADPNAQVLIGGLLLDCKPDPGDPDICPPSWFLRGILDNGGGPYFDGLAFHSYDYYFNFLGGYGNGNWVTGWDNIGPVIRAKADHLRTILGDYSVTGKYLINLESGLLCDTDWGHTCEDSFETTKAYYVAHAYAMTIGEDIIGSSWYGMSIDFPGPVNLRNTALLNDNMVPYPAYYTYRFASSFLTGATSDRDLTEFTNVLGYVFDRGGTEVWVLWSKNGVTQPITLPGIPSAAYRIGADGKPVSLVPSTSLDVTLGPIFLEW